MRGRSADLHVAASGQVQQDRELLGRVTTARCRPSCRARHSRAPSRRPARSSNDAPCSIAPTMKCDVPLTMPSRRLAAEMSGRRDSEPRNGTPASTAASHASVVWCRSASARSSGPCVRHQRLVRGHDRNARPQRRDDERARRFDAAQHFDHEVDVTADGAGGVGRRAARAGPSRAFNASRTSARTGRSSTPA